MKTKNDVRKAILKSLAILVIFLLSAFSPVLSAEDKGKATTETAATIQSATEEKLVVETWMTDASLFTSGSLLEPATESPMQIEAWMTNDKLFTSATSALASAVEPKMKVEDWMLDGNNFVTKQATAEKTTNEKKVEMWKVENENFGNRKFILTQVNDRRLFVEKWMLDNYYW